MSIIMPQAALRLRTFAIDSVVYVLGTSDSDIPLVVQYDSNLGVTTRRCLSCRTPGLALVA